jgi:alpha-galactosidase
MDLSFDKLGLDGKYEVRDLWQHKVTGKKEKKWKGKVLSHETKLFRLKKI